MTYTKQTWINNDPTTPINATRLGHIEDGIDSSVGKGDLFINVKDFGATGDGTTDDRSAIGSAITAARGTSFGGIKRVFFPAGTYCISTSLGAKDDLILDGQGSGISIIKAIGSISTAMISGTSGDTVSNFNISNLTLDGNYSGGVTQQIHGVQITNGYAPTMERVGFRSLSGSGCVFQGITGGGTPYASVVNCTFDDIGLKPDTTIGFGVLFKDASPHGKATGNIMRNVQGGMGVGGSNGSTDCQVIGNDITMGPNSTGFEAIGFTSTCLRLVAQANVINDSQDNGISASAPYSLVVGNNINGTLNHGIQMQGDWSVCVGNIVRNAGKLSATDGLQYGGVAVDGAGNCLISLNQCYDDQTTHTMAYIVKLHTSSGNNTVIFNNGSGYTAAPYGDLTGFTATDRLIDMTTVANTTLYSAKAIYGPQTTALGQITIMSSANALSALALSARSGQTAPLLDVKTSDGTSRAGFAALGTPFSSDPTKGFILRSADNNYWRVTVSNAGALTVTSLATTTLPTS